MNIGEMRSILEKGTIGREMYDLAAELFPICRSITGDGVRETLRKIRKIVPIEIHEVPSGTRVYDWTIPEEWNIRDAYIKDANGHKVVSFEDSNLHVLQYSLPVHRKIALDELKSHIHTLPEHPEWIPYRTSYYQENWGFCVEYNKILKLKEGDYEIFIDSTREQGNLTYGEYFIKGRSEEEVLISCHCCHPSLANDNLSGIALVTFLIKYLCELDLNFSYRFLFIPGTIGSITWLFLNEPKASRIRFGLVAACLGDSGGMTYKRSRKGNAEIDRIVEHVLNHTVGNFNVLDFSPYGYDERQYCSPGFDLPVGCLTRTPHGQYPEYHTSADNIGFIGSEYMADSFLKYFDVIYVIEKNRRYRNRFPKCEPNLGRRGIYSTTGGRKDIRGIEKAMLWVLNLSDGSNSLLDISERANIWFPIIEEAANILLLNELLMEF